LLGGQGERWSIVVVVDRRKISEQSI